jgi:hypothetical protein
LIPRMPLLSFIFLACFGVKMGDVDFGPIEETRAVHESYCFLCTLKKKQRMCHNDREKAIYALLEKLKKIIETLIIDCDETDSSETGKIEEVFEFYEKVRANPIVKGFLEVFKLNKVWHPCSIYHHDLINQSKLRALRKIYMQVCEEKDAAHDIAMQSGDVNLLTRTVKMMNDVAKSLSDKIAEERQYQLQLAALAKRDTIDFSSLVKQMSDHMRVNGGQVLGRAMAPPAQSAAPAPRTVRQGRTYGFDRDLDDDPGESTAFFGSALSLPSVAGADEMDPGYNDDDDDDDDDGEENDKELATKRARKETLRELSRLTSV